MWWLVMRGWRLQAGLQQGPHAEVFAKKQAHDGAVLLNSGCHRVWRRHDIGHRYRQPYFIVGTLHSCSYMPTSRVRNTGYPAGPHRYRTDVDFACHLVEARSSETFGAGSTGVNPQSQHTRLLRRLQWQLPYHPSATPSMTSRPLNDIALPPCDEAMLRDLPGAIPRANGCVPCSCLLLHGPHRLRLQADALRRRSMCCLHPSDKSQLPPAGVFG